MQLKSNYHLRPKIDIENFWRNRFLKLAEVYQYRSWVGRFDLHTNDYYGSEVVNREGGGSLYLNRCLLPLSRRISPNLHSSIDSRPEALQLELDSKECGVIKLQAFILSYQRMGSYKTRPVIGARLKKT